MDRRILDEVVVLSAPTWRSRAYAQRLEVAGIAPSSVIILPGEEPRWRGPEQVDVRFDQHGVPLEFRPGEPAVETWERSGIDIIQATEPDINSPDFVSFLRSLPSRVAIYSGFAGVLVDKTALSAGKKFLHVHGGYLPDYRGSTAFYYSILREGTIGASALWLDQGMDTGPILRRRKIAPLPGVEIDRVLDPMLRAQVLCEVLEMRLELGVFPTATQHPEAGETFHVIHPVLKHLALRRCALVRGVAA